MIEGAEWYDPERLARLHSARGDRVECSISPAAHDDIGVATSRRVGRCVDLAARRQTQIDVKALSVKRGTQRVLGLTRDKAAAGHIDDDLDRRHTSTLSRRPVILNNLRV